LSLAVVVVTTLICAFVSNFSILVAMRILAGMLAGGIFPVGIAIVGDLVPVEQRQVAIGRLLAVGLTGNLIGATISGFIGDLLGWRGVFLTIGGFGLIAVIAAFFAFRGLSLGKPKPFNFAAAAAGYRGIFADPRAKVCFGSVFFEGITIHGMFPYVALLLLASGETRSSYAGMVSLSLPVLVARVTERHMMLIGAVCASIAFILIAIGMPWYKLAAVFLLFGVGFYMLHNCIQVHVTDLSQTARATAMSMHSCFFFFGQAIGPIYYGYAFHHFGNSAPPLLGAAVILVIGLICARFLRHRRKAEGLVEGS
jgi:predicted MFS family arabinose efflux permease